MTETFNEGSKTSGVVTFLDVLGWKGVYDRKPDAITSLTTVVNSIRDDAEQQRGLLNGNIVVKSISDTIAIFTPCLEHEASVAINIHGHLCSTAIQQSIELEIPVRGATAYGEFELGENIFVGKAVDEAASWHEQADWIGVNLTPSAQYVFNSSAEQALWIPYALPTKAKLHWEPPCVNWTSNWEDNEKEIEHLKLKFRRLGPIVPEIAGKFINTLRFVKKVRLDIN